MNDFGHNPDDIHANVAGGDLGTFDEATRAMEEENADGVGIALSRHDDLLVFEATGFTLKHESAAGIPPVVAKILNTLGPTYTEFDEEEDLIRSIYIEADKIDLPTGYLQASIRDEDAVYTARLYDRGWTPVIGNHITDTPADCCPVDPNSFKRVLSALSGGDGE